MPCQSDIVVDKPQVVQYHAGGKPGTRPILTGDKAKKTFHEIPMIDMSRMFSESLEDRKAVAAEVGRACREVGFFYAQNHKVSDDIIAATFDAISKFFSQDHDTKMETHINKSPFFRGYEPLFETKLDPTSRGDMKESYTMGEDASDPEQHAPAPKSGQTYPIKNSWPKNNPDFRKAMYNYYSHVLAFSYKLLHIFALALDMPETYFDSMCSFPMTAIRTLHYPPQDTREGQDVGIGAHTDYCWFTLVCQNSVPALQVLNENGIWIPAPPVPHSFVVNIGDFLMQATNNKWQSTVHRVVNLNGERRYSMPFFFSPNEDAKITVLENCRVPGESYEEIVVGEYFKKRLQAARYKHPDGIAARKAEEGKSS